MTDEARFTYEDDDLLEFFRHVARPGLLLVAVAWVLFLGWIAYRALADPALLGELARDPFFLLVLLVGAASVAWSLWGSPRLTLRRFRPVFEGEHVLRMDERGLVVEGPRGDVRVAWDDLVKAREGKRLVLLFLAPRRAQLVPKRGLAPDQLETLRARLRERGLLR